MNLKAISQEVISVSDNSDKRTNFFGIYMGYRFSCIRNFVTTGISFGRNW